MTVWIMIANASQAYCYSCEQKSLHNGKLKLDLLETYEHPESRKKGSDLISDRPGHFQSSVSHASYAGTSDPKETEADHFAREIAEILEKAHNKNEFEQLILVVPPHFQGLLNKHLSKNIEPLISHTIQKDYTKLPILDLQHQLQAQLKKE